MYRGPQMGVCTRPPLEETVLICTAPMCVSVRPANWCIWGLQTGVCRRLQMVACSSLQTGVCRGLQTGICKSFQTGVCRGLQTGVSRGLQMGVSRGLQTGECRGLYIEPPLSFAHSERFTFLEDVARCLFWSDLPTRQWSIV